MVLGRTGYEEEQSGNYCEEVGFGWKENIFRRMYGAIKANGICRRRTKWKLMEMYQEPRTASTKMMKTAGFKGDEVDLGCGEKVYSEGYITTTLRQTGYG